MCGILGYTNIQGINPDQKKFAVSKIVRRGPDNISCQQINQVTWFAHTRLAIIDLSENGNQPYSFDNLVVSFNGVIYNFKEIRGKLKEYGYDFISSSDTEVLVKAWHLWGPESLEN